MLKKIFFALLVSVLLISGCSTPKEENEILNLDVNLVGVYKNVTLENGEISYESFANCNNFKIEYEKIEKYSGPSSYNYLIKLDTGKELYIIDQTMFIYDNHKCQLNNSTFEFLDSLKYYEVSKIMSLNLSGITKVELLPNSTTTLYLNKSDKVNLFMEKMNSLQLVEVVEPINEENIYTIKFNSKTLLVIEQKYIKYEEVTYEIASGSISFLYEYTSENTDSKQNNSGWLPWV